MAKILLVEDDAKLIESYTFLLTQVGHEVQQAINGAEGIEKVKSFQPDLVLLDMLMPGSNGLEFLQQLRDTGSTAKVVVMSNLDNFQAELEASKLGAESYILKSSLSPTQLADLVKAEIGD
ncbi:MAG TPA: response regulator [Candidatus Saccharimonadales bacterium]|nr:response regulator [Candidatus Saccharimonadales bacterium]